MTAMSTVTRQTWKVTLLVSFAACWSDTLQSLAPSPPHMVAPVGYLLFVGEDGNVWAFNFFFYNKRMKRIAYFSCRGISKSVAGTAGPEESGLTYGSDSDNEEAVTRYGMANEMDL